eukprot:TRINITY_DN19294_c0_g2_i1.p1 TRINITY_DN19294_c0_g2~~TRINITY_DN19294_c0_g2_i1.p1  ORF type:complete len:157 (-),score=19.50 TRINITY_DN19294_c0_g2_i1:369-839(-)
MAYQPSQNIGGHGGALGTTAPSAGRVASLQQVGRSMMVSIPKQYMPPGDGNEEFLRSWSTRPNPCSPFATDYSARDAPPHLQWKPAQPKVSLTAGRVLGTGGQEALIAATAAAAARQREIDAHPIRAAGTASGRTDLDMGRLGVMNGAFGPNKFCT